MRLISFSGIAFFLVMRGSVANANVGGWGSSGGGLGVACFADSNTASSMDASLRGQQNLTSAQKKQIRSLVTLDYWDWSQKTTFVAEKHRTTADLLKSFQDRINFISPIFGLRLSQLAPHLTVGSWDNKNGLGGKDKDLWENSDDAHPSRALAPNCRLVQLADRYTDHKDATANFPTKIPKILVIFDPDLYSLLDPLNQAMLVVHEEIYLMAKAIGHTDSDAIRLFVADFFSVLFYDRAADLGTRAVFQDKLVDNFGDYFLYFGDEPLPVTKASARAYSQYSRYYSFYSALIKERQQLESCMNTSGGDQPLRSARSIAALKEQCLGVINDPSHAVKILSEEEAFLLFARFAFDHSRSDLLSSEFLMVPFTDPALKTLARDNFNKTCSAINQVYEDNDGAPIAIWAAVALQYCEKAMAAPRADF